MKQVFKSDTLEILRIGDGTDGRPPLMHNVLQFPDDRAKFALSMIEKWGMAAALGDILVSAEGKSSDRVPPAMLVMRVCEVVDAAWNEMLHRGWIVTTEPIGEQKA